MNETKSRDLCEDIIKTHSVEFQKALGEGSYSVPGGHKKFKQDIKAIKEKYNAETGKGVQAEAVLQEYIMSHKAIGITILKSDKALAEKEKEQEEEKATKKIQEMQCKVRELEESQRKQKTDDDLTTVEENMKQLMDKMAEERRMMNNQLERVIEEKSRERQTYMNQGFQSQASMYQAHIEDLKKEKVEVDAPAWYSPIVDGFKKVVCAVAPSLIEMGGDIPTTKVALEWKKSRGKK